MKVVWCLFLQYLFDRIWLNHKSSNFVSVYTYSRVRLLATRVLHEKNLLIRELANKRTKGSCINKFFLLINELESRLLSYISMCSERE